MKINITGFTSTQNGLKTSNKKGVVGFATVMKTILTEAGHKADHNLENADINLVFVIDPSSINAGHVIKCAEVLRSKPSIICFDDWNIKGFYKCIDNLTENKFSRTHPCTNYKEIISYNDVWKRISNGEYSVLFPAHRTGDHSLLEIRGEQHFVDPSIFTTELRKPLESDIEARKYVDLLPVHASLANKWQELSKKKYSFINLKNITEDEVFRYYTRHRMVISPSHYHEKGGWYRNRYMTALAAGAIIVDDQNTVFGDLFKISPKTVNKKNIDMLHQNQLRAYTDIMMTKEEVIQKINSVLENFNA